MPHSQWVKSSFSDAGGNNCVEVAAAPQGGIALRESDDPDRIVVASRNALAALLATVKARRCQQQRDGHRPYYR